MFGYNPRNVGNIPRNVWRHSPESLAALPRMFEDISPGYLVTFPLESLAIFPGMFSNIHRNVWQHSPDVWQHSLEYNISPIPRIPFPVPVFLVLYKAKLWLTV